MDSEQHNRYIAFSFFAYAGFQLLMLLLMVAWMYAAFNSGPYPMPPFFNFLIVFIAIFQLLFTAPAAIAGYAVLTKKEWARIASIVGAVMSGMSVPIGTGACVYALWFFLGDRWKEVYEKPIGSQPYTTLGLNESGGWDTADQEKFRDPTYAPKPGEWR